MERIEHSIAEEPECKKAKMVNSGDSALENSSGAPTLLKKEEAVDATGDKEEVPFVDKKQRKDVSIASNNGSNNEEASLSGMEESKDICVESDEAKVKEVSVLELEERKEIATVSGDANAALESEERKDVSVPLVHTNIKEVPLLALEEKKDISVVSCEANVKEFPLLEFKDKKDVSSLSGDVNIKEIPVLGLEEKKDVSLVSGDANAKEIPLTESEEKKDSYIATTRTEEDNGLQSSTIGSSAFFPGKKLLVLDLNGLLADIVCPPPKDYVADINIARRAIFKRPFCDDFLKFCFEKFEVGIWSSRTLKNVERITDFLLGEMKSKLLFCWDVSRCAISTVSSLENQHKYVVFKELKRLWEIQDPDLPWKTGDYNETNTVLLDDSPYKALLNPPHTAIFPHSYDYQNRTDSSLGEDGDLRLYLEKLAGADNVQEFIKKNPFGQEPITKTSESWEFYSHIVGKLRS